MENNGKDHEARISKLEQARTEIEDALLVISRLEKKQSEQIVELAKRQEALSQQADEHRAMNRETDARISKLVIAIGELISRMPPPPPPRQ